MLVPSYENVDPSSLSKEDLAIITGNTKEFVATNLANNWRYEQRREAQSILDFLYLGPTAVIRDRDYLRKEGITMILVARDSRMATRNLLTLDVARDELGIEPGYVNIEGRAQFVSKFPEVVRHINNHLLSIYHGQIQGKDESGQMMLDTSGFRRGKVLIACESGNSLSAVLVTAYLMAMFGKDVPSTIQFVHIQRFCVCFDEDLKRLLQTWGDILRAQASVGRAHLDDQSGSTPTKNKRGLHDFVETEDGEDMDMGDNSWDQERFAGRGTFAPFVDVPEP